MLQQNKTKTVLFLIIFTIICVTLTIIAIFYTNEESVKLNKKDIMKNEESYL